jgi:galactose mutarotase-like enzyme
MHKSRLISAFRTCRICNCNIKIWCLLYFENVNYYPYLLYKSSVVSAKGEKTVTSVTVHSYLIVRFLFSGRKFDNCSAKQNKKKFYALNKHNYHRRQMKKIRNNNELKKKERKKRKKHKAKPNKTKQIRKAITWVFVLIQKKYVPSY